MFVILAHITVLAGSSASFEELARQLTHESVAREVGLARYEYFRREEPDRFLAMMAFDDYEGFITHQASEHHHVLAGAMREMIADLRLERIEPIPGCSVLAHDHPVISVREGLGPTDEVDIAARTDRYRQRYALPPPAWWHADRDV